MKRRPLDPVAHFHSQVRDAVLVSICRGVFGAYREAESYFKDNGFGDEQKHDALPMLRRAHVERNVKSVLGRYSDVTVTTAVNSSGNSYHNRITSGRVFLTVSAVATPGEMVREAVFRQSYAYSQNVDLFTGRTDPRPDAMLYGLILHGPPERPVTQDAWVHAQKQGMRFDRPAFIQIAFPDQELRSYLADPIDLLKRFPDQFRDDQDGDRVPLPKAPLSPIPAVSTDK